MADEQITKKELHEELGTQLGEFAEQVLLPAVERMVEDKLAGQKHDILDHVDRRLEKFTDEIIERADLRIEKSTNEIIATVKGDHERDRTFKSKVIEIFKRNKLVRDEELLILEETMP